METIEAGPRAAEQTARRMANWAAGRPSTLALRLEHRNRLRAERAERLARLRRPVPEAASEAVPAGPCVPDPDGLAPDAPGSIPSDAEALEAFLGELTGALSGVLSAAPARRGVPAEIVRFARAEPAAPTPMPAPMPTPGPAGELGRLPGAGPGLVAALGRAGIGRLAELAALEEAELAARLGPIARLIPLGTWIAAARAAAPGSAAPAPPSGAG